MRYLCICFLCFFSFCKKEDNTAPTLSIDSPMENLKVRAGASFIVKGIATDDNSIEYVSVGLLNQQSVSVAKTISVSGSGKELPINTVFEIDENLAAGTYRLVVRASDGKNESREFINIIVEERPRYFKGIFYVTKNGNSVKGFFVDSVYSTSSIYNGNDFVESSYSSKNKQVYIAGHINSPFIAINIVTKAIDWSLNAYGNGFPTFTSVNAFGENVYISFFEKIIRGYDRYGAVIMQANTPDPYIPRKILKKDQNLIVEEYYQNSTLRKLATHNAVSGNNFQEVFLQGEVVQMFEKDERDIIVFINNNNQGQVIYYNVVDNDLHGTQTLSTSQILDVCKNVDGTYFISTGNSIVKLTGSSAVTFLSNVSAQKLKIDEVNNQLISSEGSLLKIYSSTGELLKTIQAADSIATIEVITNK